MVLVVYFYVSRRTSVFFYLVLDLLVLFTISYLIPENIISRDSTVPTVESLIIK